MSDFEEARAKVIDLIRKGVLNKEQGTKVLNVYKNALAKGQNVTIDLVLEKMGVKVPAAAKGKGAKGGKAKKKAPPKPKGKILSAGDPEENKYARKRRKANKKPMIIGVVSLCILGVVAFFLFQHAQNTIDEHNRKKAEEKKRIEDEQARLNAPSDSDNGGAKETPPKDPPEDSPEDAPEDSPEDSPEE